MTDYIKTYQCPSCDMPASGRGHLCHPLKQTSPFKCEFCGKEIDNPRHTCIKMVDKIEYVCRKCGRLAIYDSLLCEPEPLDYD